MREPTTTTLTSSREIPDVSTFNTSNTALMRILLTYFTVIFNDYTSVLTAPGRWSYALPIHASLVRLLYGPDSEALEAGVFRESVIRAVEWGTRKVKLIKDVATIDEILHDHGIQIVWIPDDHPLHATHQINILDSHKQALNRLMTYPPSYYHGLCRLLQDMQRNPTTSQSEPTTPGDWINTIDSPTKKVNAKEWKPSKDCKGDDCVRAEENKQFVLECHFDGYGKYINRFDNDVPEEYLDHICTRNMALKWQQQCRRREIKKGATEYGEVEKGGPRYDERAVDFLKLWWMTFKGHYHKDDLFSHFTTNFPVPKRDKEALVAQATRVAAKIKATGSRAGTHFATDKDDPEYVQTLKRFQEHDLPIWQKVQNDQSKQAHPQKRKHEEAMSDDEADHIDQPRQIVRLKYRRQN